MEKMKELYQKVANDDVLQAKFSDIISNAEQSGTAETEKKLLDFAKEQGFDISVGEMLDFFKSLAESTSDELTETELDMVAGGKSRKKWAPFITGALIVGSAIAAGTGAGATLATGCLVGVAANEMTK